MVIQFDVAHSIDTYIHRIGRSGRCGQPGTSITFFDSLTDNVCDKTYGYDINVINRLAKNKNRMSRLLIEVLSEVGNINN